MGKGHPLGPPPFEEELQFQGDLPLLHPGPEEGEDVGQGLLRQGLGAADPLHLLRGLPQPEPFHHPLVGTHSAGEASRRRSRAA